MENDYNNQEYLQHYGVRGMRWGIRRASKTLSKSSSTSEQREKAISSLQKHRAKATKKVTFTKIFSDLYFFYIFC